MGAAVTVKMGVTVRTVVVTVVMGSRVVWIRAVMM